jgi:glycyl-tRNA synthetase beta chain
MVMAEDQALRANRLNLLFRLVQLVGRIADFGKLQV